MATLSNKSVDEIIMEPYDYLRQHPGKEIRTKMIVAFNKWLDVPTEQLQVITEVVEMLHTASLLIDDVEDDSILRRGVPVAHKIYGVPMVINSANFVYFCALDKLRSLGNPRLINIFTEELLNLHRGQGMELYHRDHIICPSEEEYLAMINNKTGGLLRLAVKLMQEASESDIDCIELVNLLGIHFQIRDDYINLRSSSYADAKGFCEDLSEGKFSFPIIHSIRLDPSNTQLINILRQRPTEIEVKSFALRLMEKTGSFEYTVKYLCRIEKQARDVIASLGGNDLLTAIIDNLSTVYAKAEEQ